MEINHSNSKMEGKSHVFMSAGVKELTEKWVEDQYISAYSDVSEGRPFCMEILVVPESTNNFSRPQPFKFAARILVFETNAELLSFVTLYGSDKLTDVYYNKE